MIFMEKEEKDKKLTPGRIDFITEFEYVSEDEGIINYKVTMVPDPNRYELLEKDGNAAYLDKYTRTLIPWDVFAEAIENMNEIPIVYSSPKQLDFCAYLKDRKSELLAHWNDKYIIENGTKPVEKILEELQGKESYIVILYVDMEGSTRLSSQLGAESYTKIMKIFLMQMAKIIDNFRGYVLKFVGDCAIGIFPAEGNFPNTCDNSIMAAVLMKSIVEDVINPILLEKGLPQIGFHIGVDIGLVKADRFGALDIASFNDLIGYPMNLTAKIQSKAGHNEILIGRQLYELIHNTWQEYCSKIDLGDGWRMEDPRSNGLYEVYKFSAKWQCRCLEP